jgi:hypothetical protein
MESIQECSRLLSNIANNVNQLARKTNNGGAVYAADLRDVQTRLDEVTRQQAVITEKLAKIIGKY